MVRWRKPPATDEPFYQQLIESAPDAMLVVDERGAIVFANRRCEALCGRPRAELLGQPVESLVPAGARTAHPQHRLSYGADPRARPMGAGLELRLVTGDGREVPVDISLSPFERGGRHLVAAAIRDVSDRKRTEQDLRRTQADLQRSVGELRRSTDLLAMSNELGDLLHSCRSVDDAYLVLTRFGDDFFPGSAGGIYRSSASGRELELARSWGDARTFEASFTADGCWAFRRGRLHIRRYTDDLSCSHLDERCRSACVPLLAQGENLGVLVVCLGPDADVPHDLEERTRSLGEHLSLALANIVLRETLRAQSIHDPLTGLYNRRYLDEHLHREFHRGSRSGTPVAVIAIDLDHFKQYNDAHGHAAGDTALISIASMLRLRSRDEDFVCRQGGEEFLVVLPGATAGEAEQRAEELREACAGLPFGSGRSLTMSAGVASFPAHGASVDDVLAAVDDALYAAKRNGRDQVVRASSPGGGEADGPTGSGPTTLTEDDDEG